MLRLWLVMADEKDVQDIVATAKKRFEQAQSYYSRTRLQAIEDTKFALADSDNGWQWPAAIAAARVIDQKVMLTVNMTAQHCNQVINNIRMNRPTARVLPADSYADKKTAEILAGLIRNIQVSSGADDAHDLASEHAVYGGEGFWRIVTEYESPFSFDQVIRIKPIANPQLVYIDPTAKEMDKSDAEWGFVFEDYSEAEFKRAFPKVDQASWSLEPSGWVKDKSYRVAEYFYCDWVADKLLWTGIGPKLASEVQQYSPPKGTTPGSAVIGGRVVMVHQERDTETKKWTWCKLVGDEEKPVDSRPWLGSYLPIIPVVGKEVNINGEVIIKGLVRDLKDPQRMVNYAYSEAIQTYALQNKTPYIAAQEAIEGHEDLWQSANVKNYSVLTFNAFDENGNTLPRPERQAPPQMGSAGLTLLQVSTEQMRAASGQQNANFGIRSEAQSGVGIERLKVQGEIATFHFPDNLRRALELEAKILIDLIQKYYDTERVVRVLGLDGKEEQARLRPNSGIAYEERGEGEDIERIFDPQVGQYDVVIDTGPSFATQRQQAFSSLTELASRDPRVMQIAGDLVMRSADFPMADELAKRFEKTLPPELKEQNRQEDQMAAALQQAERMMQQMQSVIENMGKHIQELEAERDAKVLDNESKERIAAMNANIDAAKVQVDAMNAETNRLKLAIEETKAAQATEQVTIQAQPVEREEKPDSALILAQAMASLQQTIAAQIEVQAAPKVIERTSEGFVQRTVLPELVEPELEGEQ